MATSVPSSSVFLTVLWLLLLQLNSIKADQIVDGSGENASKEGTTKTTFFCDDEDDECESRPVKVAPTTTPTTTHIQHTSNSKTMHNPTERIPAVSWMSSEDRSMKDPKHSLQASTTVAPLVPIFTIGQPRFHGNSYMVLPKLPLSARRSLELSITFKANSADGLLLYSGRRTSEQKDFLALALRKGLVELRFSNGGDTAVLKTTKNITLGTWHKVVVFRDLRDGYLTLDYGQLIRASTNQNQKQMDLNTPLYLGGLPSSLPIQSIPYNVGFNGCVKKVVVDGKKIDLRLPGGEVIRGHKIDECSNSFKKCQCQAQASCHFSEKGEPVCACPLGTAGQHCEHVVSLQIPSFTGHSYLTYPSLGDVASKSFTIRLVLKPKSETGLIMLNADRTSGQGDFFSLSLREGNVEFIFDCGSGPAVIRSRRPVIIDQWHTITIWRSGVKGSLTLDDGLPVFGESQGRLRHISLRQNLFLGGMKNYKQQPYEVDMKSGFSGCIQKVTINLGQLDLTLPLSGINVDNCDHVCVTQPICLNGGTCQAEMDSFQCECSVGYTGMFCDKGLKIKVPSFSGRSYLSYPSLGKKSQKSFTISLVLKPRTETGLILYNGKHNGKGDFVSLALRKGRVEFMFDCGSGAALIKSQLPINVNHWHAITISRTENNGQLVVDDELPVFGESPGPFRHITLKDELLLGGMKDYTKQPLTIGIKTGFVGCIQKVTVNSKPLVFSSPRSGVNVRNCDHVCVTHFMCLNGGICHAAMDSFRCQCAVGYTGMLCDKAVRLDSHSFDGHSFVTITKKKITKRISGLSTNISVNIRTLLSKGLVLFVHQPKIVNSSYFLVGLNGGVVEVRFKRKNYQEIIIKSRIRIDDGLWHKVLIQRTFSTFFVQIDDSTAEYKSVGRYFLRFYPGEMFIGGLPTHVTIGKESYWPSFQGNIRGLMIGGYSVDVTDELSVGVQARRYRTSDIH